MATVNFILGLCGSGKSWLANRLLAGKTFDEGFVQDDDQQVALVNALLAGTECVVVEISYCRAECREEMVTKLLKAAPGVNINWLCFENDLSKANKNCRERRGHKGDPAKCIEINNRLSPHYSFPDGAVIFKMWTKE